MKRKIKISPIAIKDIKEAKEYIKEENITAVNKFTKKIIEAIENLAEFPKLGMELAKKIDLITDYRYLIVDEYIVFYKFNEETVFVYRILSSNRDYMKIIFD